LQQKIKLMKLILNILLLFFSQILYAQSELGTKIQTLEDKVNKLNQTNYLLQKKIMELDVTLHDSIKLQNTNVRHILSEVKNITAEFNNNAAVWNNTFNYIIESQKKTQASQTYTELTLYIMLAAVVIIISLIVFFFNIKWKKIKRIALQSEHLSLVNNENAIIHNNRTLEEFATQIIELREFINQRTIETKHQSQNALAETKNAHAEETFELKEYLLKYIKRNNELTLTELQNNRDLIVKILNANNQNLVQELETFKNSLLVNSDNKFELIAHETLQTRNAIQQLLNANSLNLVQELETFKNFLLLNLENKFNLITQDATQTKNFIQNLTTLNAGGMNENFDNTSNTLLKVIKTYHKTLLEEFEATKELVVKRIADNDKMVNKEIERTLGVIDKEIEDVKKQMDKEVKYLQDDIKYYSKRS